MSEPWDFQELLRLQYLYTGYLERALVAKNLGLNENDVLTIQIDPATPVEMVVGILEHCATLLGASGKNITLIPDLSHDGNVFGVITEAQMNELGWFREGSD